MLCDRTLYWVAKNVRAWHLYLDRHSPHHPVHHHHTIIFSCPLVVPSITMAPQESSSLLLTLVKERNINSLLGNSIGLNLANEATLKFTFTALQQQFLRLSYNATRWNALGCDCNRGTSSIGINRPIGIWVATLEFSKCVLSSKHVW